MIIKAIYIIYINLIWLVHLLISNDFLSVLYNEVFSITEVFNFTSIKNNLNSLRLDKFYSCIVGADSILVNSEGLYGDYIVDEPANLWDNYHRKVKGARPLISITNLINGMLDHFTTIVARLKSIYDTMGGNYSSGLKIDLNVYSVIDMVVEIVITVVIIVVTLAETIIRKFCEYTGLVDRSRNNIRPEDGEPEMSLGKLLDIILKSFPKVIIKKMGVIGLLKNFIIPLVEIILTYKKFVKCFGMFFALKVYLNTESTTLKRLMMLSISRIIYSFNENFFNFLGLYIKKHFDILLYITTGVIIFFKKFNYLFVYAFKSLSLTHRFIIFSFFLERLLIIIDFYFSDFKRKIGKFTYFYLSIYSYYNLSYYKPIVLKFQSKIERLAFFSAYKRKGNFLHKFQEGYRDKHYKFLNIR